MHANPARPTNSLSITIAVTIFSALLSTTGCDTITPPIGKVDPVPTDQYPRNIASEGLDKALLFGRSIVQTGSDSKPMSVTQAVRSTADYPLNIQYRFEFFDAQSKPLNTNNQSWRFLHLAPRVEAFMQASALDTNARDWRVIVRPAH